jgi:hypothetical protein
LCGRPFGTKSQHPNTKPWFHDRRTQTLNLTSTGGLWPIPSIVEGIWLRSVTVWNAIRLGRVVCQIMQGLGRGGRPFGPSLVKGLSDTWKGAVAPNITSDLGVGIGAWTDHEIDRAIRHGISRDNRQLQPPMPYRYYARLSDRCRKGEAMSMAAIGPSLLL